MSHLSMDIECPPQDSTWLASSHVKLALFILMLFAVARGAIAATCNDELLADMRKAEVDEDKIQRVCERSYKAPFGQAGDLGSQINKGTSQTNAEEQNNAKAITDDKKYAPPSFARFAGDSLEAEWAPATTPLAAYKQNYLLVSYIDRPNNAPNSPTRGLAPYPYIPEHRELKFRFSVKSDWIVSNNKRHVLWFAYTQNSFWQVFNSAQSRPFRENNYEPELIYSYRPHAKCNPPESCSDKDFFPQSLKVLNVAYNHQSNGMSDPQSRSWWRVYVQPGFEFEKTWGADKLILLPRIWMRTDKSGDPTKEDNPNLTDYLGHGDVEARYYTDDYVTTMLARTRALQLDFAFPASNWFSRATNLNLHFHYFTGYGESLIDYNQRHQTVGVGISVPLFEKKK